MEKTEKPKKLKQSQTKALNQPTTTKTQQPRHTQKRAHTRRGKLQRGILPPTHHKNMPNPAHTLLLIVTQ